MRYSSDDLFGNYSLPGRILGQAKAVELLALKATLDISFKASRALTKAVRARDLHDMEIYVHAGYEPYSQLHLLLIANQKLCSTLMEANSALEHANNGLLEPAFTRHMRQHVRLTRETALGVLRLLQPLKLRITDWQDQVSDLIKQFEVPLPPAWRREIKPSQLQRHKKFG